MTKSDAGLQVMVSITRSPGSSKTPDQVRREDHHDREAIPAYMDPVTARLPPPSTGTLPDYPTAEPHYEHRRTRRDGSLSRSRSGKPGPYLSDTTDSPPPRRCSVLNTVIVLHHDRATLLSAAWLESSRIRSVNGKHMRLGCSRGVIVAVFLMAMKPQLG